MGGCGSCLRLLLNESDVKIHVIEPTSIAGGGENAEIPVLENHGPTLQVPSFHRPRSPEVGVMAAPPTGAPETPEKSPNSLSV